MPVVCSLAMLYCFRLPEISASRVRPFQKQWFISIAVKCRGYKLIKIPVDSAKNLPFLKGTSAVKT